MDALQAFLDDLKRLKVADQHFLGLLHILIGRKITKEDGTEISSGMTWRELAAVLKKARWHKEFVKSMGIETEKLAPRDRERFWYMAIAKAGVDSESAKQDGDKLAAILQKHGYAVSQAPGTRD